MSSAMSENRISKTLYMLRMVAICTVVLAHSNCESVGNSIDYYLLKRLACTGVFLFFFISGYYVRYKPWKELMKGIVVSIVVPWLVWGTANHVLGLILSGESFSIVSYFLYIIGSGSMYYYCTMYVAIRIILNFLLRNCKSNKVFYLLILMTIITLVFSSNLTEAIKKVSAGTITAYLNIFSWIGIVAFGYIVKEKRLIERYSSLKWYIRIFVICTIGIIIITAGYWDCSYGYFGRISVFCEVSFSVILFEIITHINVKGLLGDFFNYIGKNTLFIYFVHYPLLSILQKNILVNSSVFMIIIRCFTCVFTISALLYFVDVNIKNMRLLRTLFGLKIS